MIDPQAFVHPDAKIGANVTIGPWSYIGPQVEIGDNCQINSHVVIKGPTRIGAGNKFFQFSSIGEECQDKKYDNEPTELVIGDNNVFRESVTVHRGTIQDQGITRIGSNNLLMINVHVAHDCVIGDNCIFANNATLAGHVEVGDFVILGGMVGVHQFVKIGNHAFIGATAFLNQDVPPFVIAAGQPAVPRGINSEGLKRRGFDKDQILAIRRAFKTLYRQGLSLQDAQDEMTAAGQADVQSMVDFIAQSQRGIVR